MRADCAVCTLREDIEKLCSEIYALLKNPEVQIVLKEV